MTDAVDAALKAWEQGKAYERRERERRIGWTYMLTGASFIVVTVLALAMRVAGPALALVAFAAAVLAYGYVRARLFRRLTLDEGELWGVPSWLVMTLGALAFAAAWLAPRFGLAALVPAILVGGYATLVAAQAARRRDTLHAAMAIMLLGVAAVLPLAHAVLGVGTVVLASVVIGLSLGTFGSVRLARARSAP